MPAGKNQNIPGYCAHPAQYTISPSCDLLWRFAAGTAIAEQLPVRPFLQDVNRQAAFVLTVVPFDEIAIDLSHRSEAGQLTSPPGAIQGTGEYLRECQSTKTIPQPLRIALAPLSEWQIGAACVLAGNRPGCFAVSGQIDDLKLFAHAVGICMLQTELVSAAIGEISQWVSHRNPVIGRSLRPGLRLLQGQRRSLC